MRPRLRNRLLQTCALLVVIGAGVWGYRRVVRPDPELLARLAAEKLQEIFGFGVEYDDVDIDLIDGVEIWGLRVRTPRTDRPTLEARHVRIRHDLLALASGLYRPEAIVIDGARIVTRETVRGVALDFPFHLEGEGTGVFPAIRLRDATVLCRSMDGSERLRDGGVLHLVSCDLDVVPQQTGRLELLGQVSTQGLGQDDVRIRVEGLADPAADELEVGIVWQPMILTPYLLDALAEDLAAPLRGQEGQSGTLVVSLVRHPDIEEGEVRVSVRWTGEVKVDPEALPAGELIESTDLEQIRQLFNRAHLDVELTGGTVNLKGLLEALGGGQVKVVGWVQDGGDALRLTLQVKGMRLDAPDVRDAFEAAGREVFDTFDPSGDVDAEIVITKEPGKEVQWQVDAILDRASFRYVGTPDEDGKPRGFPYPVEHAAGHLHLERGEVWCGDIVGFNGRETTVRLRSPWEEAWTGGETGRIRFTDEGADIRLTVDATNVPTNADLRLAVAGSEFADLFDRFWLDGLIDRVEVDVIAVPGRDPHAVPQIRITLDGEKFRYARFPLLLEEVKGRVTMRRPFIGPQERGTVVSFDVEGTTEGAAIRLAATYRTHEEAGRLLVEADSLSLAGALADVVTGSELTRGTVAEAWRWLAPRGRANALIDIPLESEPGDVRLEATLLGASVRLDAEGSETPIEVTNLHGPLTIDGNVVRLDGLTGRINDAGVSIEGVMDGGPEGRWDIQLTIDTMRVTPDFVAGLEHLAAGPLLPEGFELGAGARLALDVHLSKEPGTDSPIEVQVTATALDGVVYLPEGTALAVRADSIHVEGDTVTLEGLRGEAPGMSVTIDRARVGPDGLIGRITLHLEEVEPTEEMLALLPEAVRETLGDDVQKRTISCEALTIDAREDGSLRLEGDIDLLATPEGPAGEAALGGFVLRPLELSAPDAGGARTLRGLVNLRGFSPGGDIPLEDVDGEVELTWLRLGEDPAGHALIRIHKGRVFDVRVKDVVVPVAWEQGILRAEPLRGVVADGRAEGRILVHTRAPVAYEGQVSIRGFRLDLLRDDLAPTGPPLTGVGQATIAFQNRGGETRDLTARGSLSIREGNLGDLPILANVFAFLGTILRVKEPPRFERADVTFTVEDEVAHLSRFDLAGPLFEMPGRGTIDLGGYVDIVFTPDFIKSFAVPGIMQFPVVGNVLDALLREDLLYALRLRGDVSTAEPEIVLFPPLGLERERTYEGSGVPELPRRRIPRWFR